jgi:hypothetical protein
MLILSVPQLPDDKVDFIKCRSHASVITVVRMLISQYSAQQPKSSSILTDDSFGICYFIRPGCLVFSPDRVMLFHRKVNGL